jgi:hypothetical protein
LSPSRADTGIVTTTSSAKPSERARLANSLPIAVSTASSWSTRSILLIASTSRRHPQQGEHGGVPAGLLDHAVPRVHQQHGQLGGGRPGDGVARVLDVPGGVGEDELAGRRAEVAVGDVDGDALLALRAQAVDQQRQVGRGHALVDRGALDGLDLVGEHRLGVVEQPPDQRGLAVVDTPRGGEAQQVTGHV